MEPCGALSRPHLVVSSSCQRSKPRRAWDVLRTRLPSAPGAACPLTYSGQNRDLVQRLSPPAPCRHRFRPLSAGMKKFLTFFSAWKNVRLGSPVLRQPRRLKYAYATFAYLLPRALFRLPKCRLTRSTALLTSRSLSNARAAPSQTEEERSAAVSATSALRPSTMRSRLIAHARGLATMGVKIPRLTTGTLTVHARTRTRGGAVDNFRHRFFSLCWFLFSSPQLGSRSARRVRFPMGREPPQGAVIPDCGKFRCLPHWSTDRRKKPLRCETGRAGM